jgi:uncharacterized protein (UPF0333 family)
VVVQNDIAGTHPNNQKNNATLRLHHDGDNKSATITWLYNKYKTKILLQRIVLFNCNKVKKAKL